MTTAGERSLASHEGARIVFGRVMAAIAIVLAVCGMVALVVIGRSDFITRDYAAHNALIALGFGVLTWVAVPRQPRNTTVWIAGWAALFSGVFVASMALAFAVGGFVGPAWSMEQLVVLSPSDLPMTVAIVVHPATWAYIPAFGLIMTLGVLQFPDGSLPSPRWRWVRWVSIGLVVTISGIVAWLYRPSSGVRLGASSDDYPGIGRWVNPLFFLLFAVAGVCLAGLVAKYRRSDGVRRQQYRWLAFGGGALVVALAATSITTPVISSAPPGWVLVTSLAGEAALVTSYGVAVVKYRLYDIDVVISRTFVFGTLAAFIGAVYVLIVVVVGRSLGAGDGNLVLSVIATALVAVGFEPVRLQAQRWANRLVYGRRATPYEVLSELTERLAAAEEGQGILTRMTRLLADGTGARRATVWLGPPGEMHPAATWPIEGLMADEVDLAVEGVFAVAHDDEIVGALEVVMEPGTGLSSAERSLVLDLAGSTGLVLGYQRLNESLAERARELEESRLRLLEAEDRERSRLEQELRDGAQQQIAALKEGIARVSELATRYRVSELEELLGQLDQEVQAALEEVASLAKGIYPPVLESEGLAAALSHLAAGLPAQVVVEANGVGRHPADVEAAVYFDVSEAVTNAIKHARPPIRIQLSDSDGVLRFVVADSGPGFDLSSASGGSGLENMRDRLDAIGGRLDVKAAAGAGTTVVGEIPLVSAPA